MLKDHDAHSQTNLSTNGRNMQAEHREDGDDEGSQKSHDEGNNNIITVVKIYIYK